MVAFDEKIIVMGGWVETTGAGTLRSNDLWMLDIPSANSETDNMNSNNNNNGQNSASGSSDSDIGTNNGNVTVMEQQATWTSIIPEGVPYAVTPRSDFAMVKIGVTLAVFGGEGNRGILSDIQYADLCTSSVQCGPGYKSTCAWNATNVRRGACIPCKESENCCRAATHVPREGMCRGVPVTLTSCAQTDTQWDSLMQALAPSIFTHASNCTSFVQGMCESIRAPGIPQGTARDEPLLCQRAFVCASDSPFNSLKFAPTSVCGVQGTECTVNNRPNRICCAYIEYLIAQSCEAMPAEFISYLARTRFPSCRDVNCYTPAAFQLTKTPAMVMTNHVTTSGTEGTTDTDQSLFDADANSAAVSTDAVYLTSGGPSARDGITAAVIGTSVFVHGGYTHKGVYSKETWELRAEAYPPAWFDHSPIRGGPSIGRRYSAVAALNPAAKLVVHGGEGPDFLLDDLYVLDTKTASLGSPFMWVDLTSVVVGDVPSERCMHAMIGVGASEVYAFGGKTLLGVTDEVHVCMYVCIYVCMCMYVCVCVCVDFLYLRADLLACTHACVHVTGEVHVCMYACIYASIHTECCVGCFVIIIMCIHV
jgi:hypothetical protein